MTALIVLTPGGLTESCTDPTLALQDPFPEGWAGAMRRAQPWTALLKTPSSSRRNPEGCDTTLPGRECSLHFVKGFETSLIC